MSTIAHDFIEFALEINALKFGSFTLKSGRQSPYFFNVGEFNTGYALAKLGEYYAKTLNRHSINFDMLFGPAYKGIPLVSSTAINLSIHYQRDVPYCFNRKEAKDHGEKGLLVGHALQGEVLLVDDVMTAGTAYRESLALIEQVGASLSGVIVALDRQEKGLGDYSALDEIRRQKNIPVVSICTLEDLINYLSQDAELSQHVTAMNAYQQSVAPIKL